MTIGKELADLRAGYPGCHAVVFADLSTGMVLASDTAEKTTQERLDALCKAAHFCLMGPIARALPTGLTKENADTPTVAWQSDRYGVRCFVKLPEPAAEALCLVATTEVAIDRISADAVTLLSRIALEE